MYAQVTYIQVPLGKTAEIRHILETDYLPVVRVRPGFVAAYVLEQVDDPERLEMVQFWDSHAAVENFSRTGLLESSVQALAAWLPGVRVQRQGYLVRVAMRGVPMEQPAPTT